MASTVLTAQRIVLEPIVPAHADELWPLMNDDRMWTYFPSLRPPTLDALRRLYVKWSRGSSDPDEEWLNWVCREIATQRAAGTMQATIHDGQSATVAYAIYPAFQRRGYAREAMNAAIAYLCDVRGIRSFVAQMDVRNEASYRLAESLGFVRVAAEEAPDMGQGADAREYTYELRL